MTPSQKFLFRAETINDAIFHLTACCLAEALYKAEDYVEKHHSKDLVAAVTFVHGELLEDEPGDGWDESDTEDAAGKGKKLALVVGRINGETEDKPA